MRLALFLTVFATPVLANPCPPAPELEPRKSELLAAVREAPDEFSARLLTNELWELWSQAPDAQSQELLDEGMQRRAAYDFEGAITAFDALIAYCPDYAEGYNQRAFVNFIRQDYAAALEDLDRAIALSPDHFAALSGRALSLFGLGRMQAGQRALREALAMNPWLPERRMLTETPGDDI